jgi:hypothetical protein
MSCRVAVDVSKGAAKGSRLERSCRSVEGVEKL